jgi:hypothetical protein
MNTRKSGADRPLGKLYLHKYGSIFLGVALLLLLLAVVASSLTWHSPVRLNVHAPALPHRPPVKARLLSALIS